MNMASPPSQTNSISPLNIGNGPTIQGKRSKKWALRASWALNIFLLVAKIAAYTTTRSKAVLASLADSAVDLLSQVIIALAQVFMKRRSDAYPVGRSKLEAVSVIGCACVMSLASVEVSEFSVIDLVHGIARGGENISMGLVAYLILGPGTLAKLLLYFYCNRFKESDVVQALAEDHLNDVMSNTMAIVTASIAAYVPKLWWFDPAGAILISVVIIWRWILVTQEQVRKIVGYTAPEHFLDKVKLLTAEHSSLMQVDCLRAYYNGSGFNVELEIILPEDMTVNESHDVSLELQHKVEAMAEVERAYVHVDYVGRELPEHKIERELLLAAVRRRPHGEEGSEAPVGPVSDPV